MTVADTVYNFHPPELQWLLVAKTYRSDHARRMSALPSTSDSLVGMSGFELIPSGVPSGPDVADNPGVRGVLTLSRRLTPRALRQKLRSSNSALDRLTYINAETKASLDH